MRTATLLLAFVAIGFAATAQQRVTLLPQFGLENAASQILLNDNASFNPLSGQPPLIANLRLIYESKKRQGAYIGLGSNSSTIAYRFAVPSNGLQELSAERLRKLKIETGYQFTTKAISLVKKQTQQKPKQQEVAKTQEKKSGCGSYTVRTHCGQKTEQRKVTVTKQPTPSWTMRIQPNIGVAMLVGQEDNVEVNDAANYKYQYNAGNWTTAVQAGTNFEFARNGKPTLSLSLNYLRGFGNMDMQTVTTLSNGKTYTNNFSSKASSFSATVGVPITLYHKKPVVKRVIMYRKVEQKKECIKVKTSCGTKRI